MIQSYVTLSDIEQNSNFKDMLRRYATMRKIPFAKYESFIEDDGTVRGMVTLHDHDNREYCCVGSGITKKRAEMDAARLLLHDLGYEE